MYLSTSKSSFEKKYSSTGKSTSTLYSRTYFVLKYKVLPKSDFQVPMGLTNNCDNAQKNSINKVWNKPVYFYTSE